MPYQLRRIIGINIRCPHGGNLPSQRIAQLDPRESLHISGDNGVGKSSFLRLVPLFYGATPSQILRGSGLHSLLRYILPDESSAVAYEYEREGPHDLRLVVMHVNAHRDSPQFLILRGGFSESLFLKTEGTGRVFVRRDEFKAWAESPVHGREVSKILELSEYRAVILNERQAGRDAADLRRLAAQHSMGGMTALTNLDQIAATMANEKLAFRDLHQIVIDRVTDVRGFEGPDFQRKPVSELKQNREAVVQWIKSRNHLVDIKKRLPDVERLRADVDQIARLYKELCALRASVVTGTEKNAQEREALKDAISDYSKEISKLEGHLEDQLPGLAEGLTTAKTTKTNAKTALDDFDTKQQRFSKLGAENLTKEEELESGLREQGKTLSLRLTTFQEIASGVLKEHGVQVAALEKALQGQMAAIGKRRQDKKDDAVTDKEKLYTLEREEIDTLSGQSPPRILEIDLAIAGFAEDKGRLQSVSVHPQASDKTVAEAQKALKRKDAAAGELVKANALSQDAEREVNGAKFKFEESERALQPARSRLNNAEADLASIRRQITPEGASLLAFLRGHESGSLQDSAKTLDPSLLERTDLAPAAHPGAVAELTGGRVLVGEISLVVTNISAPSWLNVDELRSNEAVAQSALNAVQEALKHAEHALSIASKSLGVARADLTNANANVSIAQSAAENAADAHKRQTGFVAQEQAAAKSAADTELRRIEGELKGLAGEKAQLLKNMATAVGNLQANFKTKRAAVDTALKVDLELLDEEDRNIADTHRLALEQLEEVRKGQLLSKGVDPNKLKGIEDQKRELDLRLGLIEKNRHIVSQWRTFLSDEVPVHPRMLAVMADAEKAFSSATSRLAEHELAVEALVRAAGIQRSEFNVQEQRLRREQEDLADLTLMLQGFIAVVPSSLNIEWTVEDLKTHCKSKRLELTRLEEKVVQSTKSIRNTLTIIEGPAADYIESVDAAERAAGERPFMLSHELASERAKSVFSWFETDLNSTVAMLNQVLGSFLSTATDFISSLEIFDRRIRKFNSELQVALSNSGRFPHFGNLSVKVFSGVTQLGHLETLREMQAISTSRVSLGRVSGLGRDLELPDEAMTALIQDFSRILAREGGVRVNLTDQIKLEFSLEDNGNLKTVSNDEEFRSVSSNGNTALIMAMFLMAFAQMVRRDSPVRLTWITDEIGRFDLPNLRAFLSTLNEHNIDVISASPLADPSYIDLFARRCIFGSNGSISTYQARQEEGALHVTS